MRKHLLLISMCASLLILSFATVASASDREDDIERINHSATVFHEIMNTPDHGIPDGILKKATCIAIIPGEKKFAFVFGGNYGRGVAVCRRPHGWTAPIFIALGGGSVGYQIGGSSTDLILVFMNEHALGHLLNDNFKLGADAAVAAGPVGRKAEANTDISLRAEILTYSRSHGIFAGVSLEGTVVKADNSGDRALYGDNVTRHDILSGRVPTPVVARPLVREIHRYMDVIKTS
jgi:SH3 domain-containing YSC84-like protein 1